MMNPPERPASYEVVIHVNEACTSATIISFKNILDKTSSSSISSGALADVSENSDSTCTVSPAFALPQGVNRSEELSVSTSSSSGLSSQTLPRGPEDESTLFESSANEVDVQLDPIPNPFGLICIRGSITTDLAIKRSPVRSQKQPCFSRVKIVCSCGSCEQSLPAKLSNGIEKSTDLGSQSHDAILIDTPHSDMDLTLPLGGSTDSLPPHDDTHPEEAAEPQIRLRQDTCDRHVDEPQHPQEQHPAEGLSSTSSQDPPLIRIRSTLTCVNEEDKDEDEDDDTMPTRWDWRPKLLERFTFPEQLPEADRQIEVPSHYVEDPNSILFGMTWLIETEHARERLQAPPLLTTRIFYDPAMTEPSEYKWPQYVLDSLKQMTKVQRQALYDDFVRARNLAFARNPHLKRGFADQMEEEQADAQVESPVETFELSSDDDGEDELTNEPGLPEGVLPVPAELPPAQMPAQVPVESQTQDAPRPSQKRAAVSDESDGESRPSLPAKRARVDSSAAVPISAPSECPDPGVLFVYARCEKWYYPGTLKCTLDEWDSSVKPLKVVYCDKQEKELPPDQIFPMVRLPPGANIQRQTDDTIYEDVFFLSSTYSVASGSPSARLLVQDPDDGTTEEVTFDNTALSPKDVIRLRSALKQQFYPSRIRKNFTELTEGAILFTASRRCRTQNVDAHSKKPAARPSNSKSAKGKQTTALPSKTTDVDKAAAVPSKTIEVAKSGAVPLKTPEVAKSGAVPLKTPEVAKSAAVPSKAPGVAKSADVPSKTPEVANSAAVPLKTPEVAKSAAVPSKAPGVAKSADVPSKTPDVAKAATSVTRRGKATSEKTQTKSTPEMERRIKMCSQYRCAEKSCHKVFASSAELVKHRKLTSRTRRRHVGQAIVFRCDVPDCSTISTSREQFRRHLASHSQVTQPSRSPPMASQEFAKPSSSGVTPGRAFRAASDTDTDTSPSFRYSRPSGHGLQDELTRLGETAAKSFTGFKTSRKNEATSDIFKGYHFVLTKGVESKTPQTKKKSRVDSESDSTDCENYYHTNVKFDVAALQRAIEIGGGKLHENVTDVPQEALQSRTSDDPNKQSVVIVSNHPCTTPNYIHGVALGLTLLRHDTILECAKKGVSLRSMLKAGSASLLSPGWDRQRQTWVPPRASRVTPLSSLTLMSVLADHHYWHQLVRLLGGRSIEWLSFLLPSTSGVFAILADHSIGEDKRSMAAVRRLPIVTTEWLVQAVITGAKPPVYQYQLPSTPSTS